MKPCWKLLVIDFKLQIDIFKGKNNLFSNKPIAELIRKTISFIDFHEDMPASKEDREIIESIEKCFSEKKVLPISVTACSEKYISLFDYYAVNSITNLNAYLDKYSISIIDSRPFLIGGYLYIIYAIIIGDRLLYVFSGGQLGGIQFVYESLTKRCFLLNQRGDAKRSVSLIPELILMLYSLSSCDMVHDDKHILNGVKDAPVSVVLCEGNNAHFGTAIVSDYSALEYFIRHNFFGGNVILGKFKHSFFSKRIFEDSFKDIRYYYYDKNIDIWKSIGDGFFIFVRPTLNYVTPHSLVNRVIKHNICELSIIDQKERPLIILINIRAHTRTCNFSAKDFRVLHKKIKSFYPSVHYIFDGMTSFVHRPFTRTESTWAKREIDLYKSVTKHFKDEFTYEITVGETAEIKIKKFQKVNIAIMTYGSGFLFPYLLKIDTIMLASFSHALNRKIENEKERSTDQDFLVEVIAPRSPSEIEKEKLPSDYSLIKDNSSLLSFGLYNECYEINFEEVGERVIKILEMRGRLK